MRTEIARYIQTKSERRNSLFTQYHLNLRYTRKFKEGNGYLWSVDEFQQLINSFRVYGTMGKWK